MKKRITLQLMLVAAALIFASCEIYIVDPAVDARTRFTGTFDVEEYSTTNRVYRYFTIDIYNRTSNTQEVWIDNFGDTGYRVKAVVSFESLTIPTQYVGSYEIQGSGYMVNHQIQFTYSIRDMSYYGPTDYCNAVAR